MIAFALNMRERQVAGLVLDGKTDAEIAAALGLAKPTIRTHLERLAAKLGGAGRPRILIERHRAKFGGDAS